MNALSGVVAIDRWRARVLQRLGRASRARADAAPARGCGRCRVLPAGAVRRGAGQAAGARRRRVIASPFERLVRRGGPRRRRRLRSSPPRASGPARPPVTRATGARPAGRALRRPPRRASQGRWFLLLYRRRDPMVRPGTSHHTYRTRWIRVLDSRVTVAIRARTQGAPPPLVHGGGRTPIIGRSPHNCVAARPVLVWCSRLYRPCQLHEDHRDTRPRQRTPGGPRRAHRGRRRHLPPEFLARQHEQHAERIGRSVPPGGHRVRSPSSRTSAAPRSAPGRLAGGMAHPSGAGRRAPDRDGRFPGGPGRVSTTYAPLAASV